MIGPAVSRLLTRARNRSSLHLTHVDFLPTWIVVCLVVALCYFVPKLTGALISNPKTVWPLWPGCAILAAGLLVVRPRVWPLLIPAGLAGFALYDLQAGVAMSSIAWFVLADAVQVLIVALGLKYSFDGVPQLNSKEALAKYSFFAVFLAPLIAAFISAQGIGHAYWSSWRICFFSDVLAFVTVMPAILSWVGIAAAARRKSRSYYLEAAAQLAVLVLFGSVTLASSGENSSPALLYSLVPILLWSALRIGWAGISTSLIVVAFLSIWGAVHGRGPFAVEGPLGNPMWLQLQLFLIFAAAPFMVLAAAIEERKAAEQALAGVNRKLIQVQDQERTRIARDLHDDLGQRLSLLAIELDVLAHDPAEIPARVRDGIVHTRDQASVITSDVHTLSHRLHSQKLEILGVAAAMKGFCQDFSDQRRVEVDFSFHGLPDSVPAPVSLCLFRVLQEGLQNAVKHSGVRHFEVTLWAAASEINLTISDRGVGFDPNGADQSQGIGLISMRERMQGVQGRLSIESQPKCGTTVHACVSLKPESAAMRAAG